MKAQVNVMLKDSVLDPQGEAVKNALEALGFFETLKSPQVALWSYASKIYDFFEEHNRAEFARSCADEVREIVRAPCKL